MKHERLFYKRVFIVIFFSTHNEVDSTTYCLCPFKICSIHKHCIIKSVELITTNRQFFQELWIRYFRDICITVVLFVTRSIVIHCLLQSSSNSNIVNNKPAFFITEYTVYTSNCLHKIMSRHRFIYIHRSKRRNIKSC